MKSGDRHTGPSVLVVATRNGGKLREIKTILDGLSIEIRPAADLPGSPEPAETGATYRENALIKARALRDFAGFPALADDSGLEVGALGGAPGVLSARYAGPEQDAAANRRRLLDELVDVSDRRRGARFVCLIALALPDGREFCFEGTCTGRITREPRGGGGFGYDPVFLVPGLGMTMAELEPARKNHISHRGRALRSLRKAAASGAFAPWLPG